MAKTLASSLGPNAERRVPRQPTVFERLVGPAPGEPMDPLDATRCAGDITLRESVLRDMGRLLNATRLLDESEARAYPNVARSVVNYGVPPLAGTAISSLDIGYVEDAIRQALMCYEPRLLPESIEVRYTGDEARVGHRNLLTFEIAAKLRHSPRPVPMLVYTDLDLESGAASVRELTEP